MDFEPHDPRYATALLYSIRRAIAAHVNYDERELYQVRLTRRDETALMFISPQSLTPAVWGMLLTHGVRDTFTLLFGLGTSWGAPENEREVLCEGRSVGAILLEMPPELERMQRLSIG